MVSSVVSGSYNIGRIIVHVLTILVTLIAMGFIVAAVMSTGWQIMAEIGGVGEIHQHGLWFDYVRMHPHAAGAPGPMSPVYNSGYNQAYNAFNLNNQWGMGGPNAIYNPYDQYQWIMTYKFGDAVTGVDVHRAQPYQINTLVLLCITLVLGVVGTFLSYCAGMRLFIGIAWSALLFIGWILGAGGLIQFYVASMLPEYRFAYTDRRMEQIVGYSFYWAVVGIIGVGLAWVLSIITVILVWLANRDNGNGNDRRAFYTYTDTNGSRHTTLGRQEKVLTVDRSPVIRVVERPVSPVYRELHVVDPGHNTPV